ncbi:MAG: LptF/LptG family permease [Bacteroidetes bacterium]|nr:LptF/LptG family permease [Bacteroidota bacterium]
MRIKTLHTFLLKAYLPSFFLTLFIGVFVFFLIHIFTYLDDLIGKGLGFWVLCQFFSYSFLTFIPAALPLAVLLSSIMTFGSLAENYELAAMKSAGLSLFRIIRPIFAFIVFLAVFTFYFNNYVLSYLTLKSASLLYDIRESKPTVNLKEGTFYSQLNGYNIRVGKKGKDGHSLQHIIIYDHSSGMGNNIQMYADSGYMGTSADTSYLELKLKHGTRYEDILQEERQKRTRPLMQLIYDELDVNIDVSDFKMKRTDEELFKGHHEMMNIWQIDHEIDSFNLKINDKYKNIDRQFKTYFLARTFHTASLPVKPITVSAFYNKLNHNDFRRSVENAQNLVRSSSSFIDSMNDEVNSQNIQKLEYSIGWHKKISISFACIVLFFVGAPLGAIIRKGGMGLPVVVAVIFFLLYYVVSIIFERLATEEVYTPFFGMWFPLLMFLPFGIFLTYMAATDSAMFDMSTYKAGFKNLVAIFRKKK